jgi:DNA-directed RNA polymerase specialized sigma24 family protein
MSAPELQSISQWIAGLKVGELEVVDHLWNRYRFELARLAHRHLDGAPKGVADEEDVAACVFFSVYRGFAAGRFEGVSNRDDLWWLLLAITRQKSIDHVRRELAQKRGEGRVHPEAAPGNAGRFDGGVVLDQLIGKEPTPEFLVALEEQHRRLLEILDEDILRRIAASRIDGCSIKEIAQTLGVSVRSVERKLKIIRAQWAEELGNTASNE